MNSFWQKKMKYTKLCLSKMFILNLYPLVPQSLIAFGDMAFKEMSKLNQVNDIP